MKLSRFKVGRAGLSAPRSPQAGYFLMEMLVYIGVLFALLGIGYVALYRCVDSSVALRRNAEEIARAIHAGEYWRADVRAARQGFKAELTGDGTVLHLLGARNVDYRFAEGVVSRRVDSGPWIQVLERVKASTMQPDAVAGVTALRWELELETKTKATVNPSRIRPLFTFLAVPQAHSPQ